MSTPTPAVAPRAVITCVGCPHLLRVSLPYNRQHLSEVLVVTSRDQGDDSVADICRENRAEILRTNAFRQGGKRFNKYLAVEQGLEALGRRDWLCLMDCDVLWPVATDLSGLVKGRLYSFDGRWLLEDEYAPVPPEPEWPSLPLDQTNPADGTAPHSECQGYTQIFHADDRRLGEPPWHRLDLDDAGFGDSLFQSKWPLNRKIWLPWKVLHLGLPNMYWKGRVWPPSGPDR